MMVEALTILLHQLNAHLANADGAGPGAPAQAVWGNIAQLDRQEVATELENHVVLSLVNFEEERALKNARSWAPGQAGEVLYRNQPLHLNLYLLFTVNYRNYGTALRRLTQLLTFFQGKQSFTPANSPGALPSSFIGDFSLSMDLMSPSFEVVNHVWGFLGARQLPFALYRSRLVSLKEVPVLGGAGVVSDIDVQTQDAAS